jgi:hypothetical protein
MKDIEEVARKVPVIREADVLVVGGGPAGHSAAVAAARAGADTVLLERYGHLGGMATGGLVTLIHSMSDGTNTQVIGGQAQEWFDRMDVYGAIDHPAKNEIGSTDPAVLEKFNGFYFRCEGRLIYGARFDSEIMKFVLNEMIEEARVSFYFHAFMTDVIMEGNAVRGVIFESKSGRQAILAKMVIDATGDGDIFARAGCAFNLTYDAKNRLANPALCIEFGNVDWKKNEAYRAAHQEQYAEWMKQLDELNGFSKHFKTTTKRNTVAHFNMFLKGYDVLKVEDLTRLEVDVRKRMMITYKFFRENIPGFENCFIMITAPQIGLRGSRILKSAYQLNEADALAGKKFEDTIAEFPPLKGISPDNPHVYIPYRSLLPLEVDNLLIAGRAFDSDFEVNEHFNTISHCIAMGQAIGTASAMIVDKGINPGKLDIRSLREKLKKNGALFPDF